jgi:hypothetical protein
MKARQYILLALGLAVMVGGGGLLLRLKSTQRLGKPGIKVSTVPGSDRLRIDLPERVQLFASTNIEPTRTELETLPRDTTLARRLYRAPDGFQVMLNVVMMGSDRTSIHKPEYCLTGQGWQIVRREPATLPIERPHHYDLPVQRYTTAAGVQDETGQVVRRSGVFVFWFVAEDKLTASHWVRMGWITRELLRRGVLPRWAYIAGFAACPPGQEEQTFERLKQFLAAAVPEFQTTTPPAPAAGLTGR